MLHGVYDSLNAPFEYFDKLPRVCKESFLCPVYKMDTRVCFEEVEMYCRLFKMMKAGWKWKGIVDCYVVVFKRFIL